MIWVVSLAFVTLPIIKIINQYFMSYFIVKSLNRI